MPTPGVMRELPGTATPHALEGLVVPVERSERSLLSPSLVQGASDLTVYISPQAGAGVKHRNRRIQRERRGIVAGAGVLREREAKPQGWFCKEVAMIHADAANNRVTTISDH
jgi:hypothetical protein